MLLKISLKKKNFHKKNRKNHIREENKTKLERKRMLSEN